MASVDARLSKLREERIAREKARIEKLRELNLKKYSKSDILQTHVSALKTSTSSASIHRLVKSDADNKLKKSNTSMTVKNNFHVKGTSNRPITVPNNSRKSMFSRDMKVKLKVDDNVKVQSDTNDGNDRAKVDKVVNHVDHDKCAEIKKKDVRSKQASKNAKPDSKNDRSKVVEKNITMNIETDKNTGANISKPKQDEKNKRKTINFVQANKLTQSKLSKTKECNKLKPTENARKSMLPQRVGQSVVNVNPNRESVFERLYQPKVAPKKEMKEVEKIRTDPNYLKKVIINSRLILGKRQTCFEPPQVPMAVRRSISAVHFKRISKSEINNCVHKWASVGEKLDKISLKDVNEDHSVKEDKVISAVKSERKKVKFQTPVPFNFNTPKPEELQSRLQNWLQKRGKSIDSYHHLQCFGINHLSTRMKPLNLEETAKFEDDENKENVPLDSDSDNESYNENMNELGVIEEKDDEADKNKWRHASVVSDSVDLNETQDSTLTSGETPHPQADKLLLGALNDLNELLREGFDWEQCARWLRAIRSRFPSAPDSAAYWECRAALEERRGDLPTSIHCWEEAIAKGTEKSVVEANLDQLLGKFMQLKISPNSGKRTQVDPKMIDVKNIFKSTIIRFAVQQAKLRQSSASEHPKYTCTPVRRSARLSRARTPLQVVESVRQAALVATPVVFVPNHTLSGTP